MAYRIVLRQDTSENWETYDPILLSGEFGFETETNLVKLGDGIRPWNELEYWTPGPTGATGATGPVGTTYYGHFYDTTFQGVAATGEASYVRCDTTNISNGIYVTGATAGPSGATGNFRFVVENSGVYEIKLSGNVKTCGNGERFVFVWLAQNSVDVPYSGQMIEMSGNVSNPDYADFNWHYPVTATGSDYFEIKYGNDLCPLLGFEPVTGASGSVYGSVPSVSVTITQM